MLQPRPTVRLTGPTTPAGARAAGLDDRRIHRLELLSDERDGRHAQPVTTPARTWRDLAGVLEPPALLAVTDQVVRWIFHCGGLPVPELQFVVRDASGGFLARADFAGPERRVMVESDGDIHRDRDVFVKNVRRQNLVVAARWTMLRYTSADALGRPDDMVAEVRRALRA